jgi:hypothetical protein
MATMSSKEAAMTTVEGMPGWGGGGGLWVASKRRRVVAERG